jgi:hypothetical protein
MPRTEFDESNRIVDPSNFPKFKLEKDEHARIVALENPFFEWAHDLRAPKILNGEAVMEERRRKDGSTYNDYSMDFLGRPLCLGDLGILQERQIDPQNCPACKLASEGDMVQAPVRRFAMHVIRYKTRPGTFELTDPFNVDVVVWAFTDRYYTKLLDLKKEWGNLQQRDLQVKCTVSMYQNFDIGVGNRCEWLASDERKQLTAQMFKGNQAPDLSVFCGRKVEARWLEDDLNRIRERWALVRGRQQEVPDLSALAEPSLSEGLDDLLSQQSNTPVPAAPQASVDVADLLSSPGTPAAPPAAPQGLDVSALVDPSAPEQPAVTPSAPTPPAGGESLDFSDLLNIGG